MREFDGEVYKTYADFVMHMNHHTIKSIKLMIREHNLGRQHKIRGYSQMTKTLLISHIWDNIGEDNTPSKRKSKKKTPKKKSTSKRKSKKKTPKKKSTSKRKSKKKTPKEKPTIQFLGKTYTREELVVLWVEENVEIREWIKQHNDNFTPRIKIDQLSRSASSVELLDEIWFTLLGQNVEEIKKYKPTVTENEGIVKAVTYDFNPKEMPSVNVDIGSHDVEPKETKNQITPEILLQLAQDNDFCTNVANTLYYLYSYKSKQYKQLQKNQEEQNKKDEKEREGMERKGVDTLTLNNMFAHIGPNTLKAIKFKDFSDKAIHLRNEITPEKVCKMLRIAITDKNLGIMSISGGARAPIRNQLSRQLFILSKGYRAFTESFINMVFTGPAGVGKTRLANSVAFVYKQMGILLDGQIVIGSPKDFISGYVGQTASKTSAFLTQGLEGIIFIDEAYQLMPCEDGKLQKDTRSFGPEAITEIVNFLDKYIGMYVMIVAGYKREMDNCFFPANEGLERRFPIRINLPSYSVNDLLNIFINVVNNQAGKNLFDKETSLYVYTLLYKLNAKNSNLFKNQAGDMLNLASAFMRSYYGSYSSTWSTLSEKKIIIDNAFNEYLINKGVTMKVS